LIASWAIWLDKPEPLASLVVGELAGLEDVRLFPLEAFSGEPVARRVEPLDRRPQGGGRVGVGDKLDLDDKFHMCSIQIYAITVDGTITRSLPTAEAGGFLARTC
jgi:hypothetical protein